MSDSYNLFAYVYDEFISDVDYKKLCNNLLNICKKYSHKPKLVLDAACGTGNFTSELVKHGLDVIGVDKSSEMLSVAREKLPKNTTLICQDLCELDLYGTIDTVFCTLDSLNHITDYEDFKTAISKMALFLEPGGLMFFDVNTVYKHKHILSNNMFADENENIYLVWQNELLKDNIVNINLDFFAKQDDGAYLRFCENFDERAYTDEEIKNALSNANLEILETRDFFSDKSPTTTSEKIIYIVKKGENKWIKKF